MIKITSVTEMPIPHSPINRVLIVKLLIDKTPWALSIENVNITKAALKSLLEAEESDIIRQIALQTTVPGIIDRPDLITPIGSP